MQLAAPGTLSPFQQIEREVVVVPEPVSNALILSTTPRYSEEIEQLVEKLDAQPAQVMIQVLIADVSLRDTDEFGVELGLQDSVLFNRSVLAGNLAPQTTTTQQSTPSGIITQTHTDFPAATLDPGYLFNSKNSGNSGSSQAQQSAGQIGPQALTNLNVGRINNELGFGGLVLSASSDSVSVLLRALQESERLEVLGRPQIRTLDNQPAFIQIGARVPRITGTTVSPTIGQVNQIALENVGLILGVTPRISPDGKVVMEIDAERSELGPESEGIPVSIVENNIIRSPRINTTMAQATVSAADGETIILGGLITKNNTDISRKVPYLADIPLFGELLQVPLQTDTETRVVDRAHAVRRQRPRRRRAAETHRVCPDALVLGGRAADLRRGGPDAGRRHARRGLPAHQPAGQAVGQSGQRRAPGAATAHGLRCRPCRRPRRRRRPRLRTVRRGLTETRPRRTSRVGDPSSPIRSAVRKARKPPPSGSSRRRRRGPACRRSTSRLLGRANRRAMPRSGKTIAKTRNSENAKGRSRKPIAVVAAVRWR